MAKVALLSIVGLFAFAVLVTLTQQHDSEEDR